MFFTLCCAWRGEPKYCVVKRFQKGQKLILVRSSGTELVEYMFCNEAHKKHLVCWQYGAYAHSDLATDDQLFTMDRYGLRCAIDAEIERRANAAKADLLRGNQHEDARLLVQTFEIIGA